MHFFLLLKCVSLKSNLDNLALSLILCSNKHLNSSNIKRISIQSIIFSKLSGSKSVSFSYSSVSNVERKTSVLKGFSRQVSLTGEVLGFKVLGSTEHGVKLDSRLFKSCSNNLKNSSRYSFSKVASNKELETL